MDILIEDIQGSLLVACVDKKRIEGLAIDPESEIIRWGSVYWARVERVDAGLNLAFVDLGYGFKGVLHAGDVLNKKAADTAKSKRKIGKLLAPGEMVAVQVKTARNPIDNDDPDRGRNEHKASKVSMDIALPGRYMIYAPLMDGNRVSRRISDPDMRKNLQQMIANVDEMNGCILRASAANCQTDILIREGRILSAIWDSLGEYMEGDAPQLLMLGPDAIQRSLSDQSSRPIERVIVNNQLHYEECYDWCDLYAPEMLARIENLEDPDSDPVSLIEHFDLTPQLDELVQRYVVLDGGGFIIIQETAALTVIDVDSGTDSSIPNANKQAADEIARQIELRNLGGIIIIDFINPDSKAQKDSLLSRLKNATSRDACTVDIKGWTKLGLVELTRQRRTPTLMDRLRMLGLVE